MPPPPSDRALVSILLERFAPLARKRIENAHSQGPAVRDGSVRGAADAYEQVIDSLAIVAKHTPVPLLEAIFSWRDGEWERKDLDSQLKLSVECIFCSAVIRVIKSCNDGDSVDESLWTQLESFCFESLINLDRVLCQVENPSSGPQRGYVLDLLAQLVGAMSLWRFSSLMKRFFFELDRRKADASGQRAEALAIISGMRYFQLGTSTPAALRLSAQFLIDANPLARAPAKKKTEFQHAMCDMLASILFQCAENLKGQWPPKGHDESLVIWYRRVESVRNHISQWMEKHSKHYPVAYPLITVLLCLGEPDLFLRTMGVYLETLYKLFREKNYRSMALDCMHWLLRFYLSVHASGQPYHMTSLYLQEIVQQLLASLKSGRLTLESQHDKVVQFCITVAEIDLDFAINHMILDLLRMESLGEPKVIGLRALLAVLQTVGIGGSVYPRSSHARGESSWGGGDYHPERGGAMSFRASYGGGPVSSQDDSKRLSLADSPRVALPPSSLPALPSGLCSYLNVNHGGLQPYLPKIRNQLTIIFKLCHATFSKALLISSKVINETIPKEKQTGWLVFRWTLKCVPHLLDPSTDRKMMDYIPTYGLCIDPGVREEAIQVLFRTVRHLPHSRFAVMRGMANFILRIPDDLVMLINVSLTRLVQLMNEWRNCLAQETAIQEMASDSSPWSASSGGGGTSAAAVQSYSLALDREMCGPPVNGFDDGGGLFDPSGIDAVGLIFLCSKDVPIRRIAIELLSSVRALQYDLAVSLGNARTSPESGQTFVIDVFEEAGEDIVQRCYWDIGRWSDLRREYEPIPVNVNLMSVLEDVDRLRWARCLNELVKCVAELCPDTVQGARFEVQARLSAMVHAQDGNSRLGQGADSDKLDQWHIYCMFAWGCPMDDGRDLLRLTLSTVKTGADTFLQYSAAVALGRMHHNMYESMLTEVNAYVEEVSKEAADRPKWKSQKLRREDWKSFVAQVYRMASESIWPGMLGKKRVLRTLFLKFIHDCVRYISSSTVDMFHDVQAVRYALASVLRALSVDLSKYLPDKFDTGLRKQLFELMWSWCDDANHDHGGSEYRKELERYKAAQATRLKDQGEKHAIERELNDQVECIHWAALHAMAALLAGPCFDDGARKMSGKVMGWINGLFMGTTERVPIGFPPPDAHMPSPHARGGLSGNLEHSHRSLMGRENKRPGPSRLLLAKTALLNLLLTNSDLFNSCINQCYCSDPSIADGYFSVLAEVYMRQDVPDSEIAVILSLILYKVVDPSKQIRDDALQMLEALSERKWSSEGESGCGSDRYRAAVVGSLPDSYQQFQYQLSATLAREHQELSVFLCEEIMQRQLDAVDIIAQHQVLTCMAPWIENLNFVALWSSGWSERLLKSLYYVTWKHGDQFPDEIEKQWSTVAAKWRNIIPVLDFLITKGINEFDSNALGEISGGAFSTYLSIAKRICLYLARISPQQTIDHLMYQVANRKLEDRPDIVTRPPFEVEEDPILFSQGHPQLDFPTLPQSSPMYRGGSFDGISRTSGLGGNNWRTSASRGFSGLLNGGVASVRSSSGSLRAHHISRDSGDLNMDTPRSTDDLQGVGTPMGSQTGYIGMTGPLHAGFLEQHHWLSRADIALILLTEIAYENDEDFRGHLPLLFHVMFVLMDSSEDIVLEHCQQLLVNLLYSLAGRHLELYDAAASVEHGDGEYKHQVVSLIKYLQSRKGTMMWENEDMTLPRLTLTSATLLGSLVSSVVDAIFFQGDLRERWGDEALRWAMECTSRHLACRSHQIYRALHPPVTSDTCVLLLRCVHRCLQNPTPPILGFVVETLLTLQVVVEAMEPEKVILYPQMFWGCVAMLHTDYVDVYTQVLELFARVIDRLAFNDYTAENVLLSNVPKEYVSPDQDRGRNGVDHRIRTMMGDVMPAKRAAEEANEGDRLTHDDGTTHHALGLQYVAFEGVQALILKGLLSTSSHWAAVEVLSRIALLSCDKIFGSSETRLLMHMVGLLPWLCVQLQSPTLILTRSCSSSSSSISTATAGTAGWGGSYQQLRIRQQQSKARSVAGNISQICADRSLEDLAMTFALYAEGAIGSVEEMLDRVAPAICKDWFPRQASLAFSYLMRLLEKGPTEFREIALLMIHALLVNSEGEVVMGPRLAISVAQLVQGPLCREAVLVLDALLDCRAVHGLADSNREDRGFRPQRVGRSNGAMGVGSGWMGWAAAAGEVEGEPPETANDPAAEFPNDISFLSLPSREESQEQVLLMLGKVLDTYGPGKKRDNRRLVPFAAPTFGGPLGREESKKGKSENVEDEH